MIPRSRRNLYEHSELESVRETFERELVALFSTKIIVWVTEVLALLRSSRQPRHMVRVISRLPREELNALFRSVTHHIIVVLRHTRYIALAFVNGNLFPQMHSRTLNGYINAAVGERGVIAALEERVQEGQLSTINRACFRAHVAGVSCDARVSAEQPATSARARAALA